MKTLSRLIFRIYYVVKFLPYWNRRLRMREARAGRRGFVAIQVDALAYDVLKYAFEKGSMRGLRREVKKGRMELRKFHSDLPAATPSAQAGILFGAPRDIPGFRYYEKAERSVVSCNHPNSVRYVRSRLKDEGPGILEGGSSYANIFDGGADTAVFTVATSRPQTLFNTFGGPRFLLLAFTSPIRVARTCLYAMWESLLELLERRRELEKGEGVVRTGMFPVVRALTAVLLTEMQTIGVLLDIFAGTPYIYTTYAGYDEVAHHHGADTKQALRQLRMIDARISEIRRMIKYFAPGRYDLVVLSDHGMTAAIPFEKLTGQTLGEYIGARVEKPVASFTGVGTLTSQRGMFITRELEAARSKSRPVTAITGIAAGKVAGGVKLADFLNENYYVDEDKQLVVTYSSPLAHLYFSAIEKRLHFEDIEERHGEVLAMLVECEHVNPVLALRSDGVIVVLGNHGRAEIEGYKYRVTEGEDPLRYLRDEEYLSAIRHLLSARNCGDLVLFGAYDGNKIVCFDDQVAGHGCLGGPQNGCFLLTGHDARFAPHGIRFPADLYRYFRRYHS